MQFVLAWRNLWRQPRRTWLTSGAMVFSNILLVFMISVQLSMYELMLENNLRVLTGHLQVQAEGYKEQAHIYKTVPDIAQLAEKIRQESGRQSVTARANGFALLSSRERSYGAMLVGVQAESEKLTSSLPGLVKQGQYLTGESDGEVVLGAVLAKNLKIGIGDEVTLMGTGKDGSFAADVLRVIGIFESGVVDIDRSFAQMPLTRFQETFSMGTSGHSVVILNDDLHHLESVQASIKPLVDNIDKVVLLDWDALEPGLRLAIEADMASAWFMYSVLIILVAFSVLNTQLMSVMERTREFGIVLSLGMRPGKLGRLIMLEACLMAMIGFLFGILFGGVLVSVLAQTGFSMPGMEEAMAQYNLPGRMYPRFDWVSIGLGPGVVFVACLLASLYPACRILFLHPVQAMRSAL